jgi:hypothetical protein
MEVEMADKKKWDDKKEGMKPWEYGYKSPKKPTMPAKKKKKKKPAETSPAGPGSVAEDIAKELEGRNKKIADKVGGWSKGKPKKKK